jgi:hypothetical protein
VTLRLKIGANFRVFIAISNSLLGPTPDPYRTLLNDVIIGYYNSMLTNIQINFLRRDRYPRERKTYLFSVVR